jgi:hypothetical protein
MYIKQQRNEDDMRETRDTQLKGHRRVCWENLKEEDHLEDPGVGGTIILKSIFKTQDGRVWTGFIGLTIVTSGRLM